MMPASDWYINKTWNTEIEAAFETRLRRSKGAYHKAQYLRIQAGILLDSSDLPTQLTGIKLMERLITEYPAEESSTILGQELLGDYYLEHGEYDKAEQYFLTVTEYYRHRETRSGTSGKADLKLAETYLVSNQTGKFDEAYRICKEYPTTMLTFIRDKFYYLKLVAQICDQINMHAEARDYAKAAIEIAKITEPQFSRHKTMGLVKVSYDHLQLLKQIAGE